MADKEQVIQALRATLLSVKGALTIKQCNRDYRELQGEWIPYKKLGYPSLEKLFIDVPGFKVIQKNEDWYVDAIATQETQHIAAMVSKQKTSKKALGGQKRFPRAQGLWRKPAFSYTPSYNNQYSKQYYRAKVEPPHAHNNYKAVKYNYKTNETRNSPPPTYNRAPLKTNNHFEQTAPKVNTPAPPPPRRHTPPPPTETKPAKLPVRSVETVKASVPVIGSAPTPAPAAKVSASQRLSNLRERLNTVDLIPLQLPAANNERVTPHSANTFEISGPVTHVTPAYNLEPPPDTTSSVAKLEWTCKKLGLPQPIFKFIEIKPKGEPVAFHCSAKVGTSYTAQSYPDPSPSEDLSKELAAMKLLSVIEKCEVAYLPTSSDGEAVARLADLVAEHEAGIWAGPVSLLYREKYRENLPSNWQELVENCPRIVMERVGNGLIIYPRNNEGSAAALSPAALSPAAAGDTIDSDLPPLQFPDDDFWNVYVTVANSTIEIWIRIIGQQYSVILLKLLQDMDNYYQHYGTNVDKSMLIINAWYAVNLDDGGWQRAKILEIHDHKQIHDDKEIHDDTVTVFLGDHGDDEEVPIDKIKILEPQFRKVPAQAVLCRLEGAEELAAHALGAELVRRRLPGETLVAAPGPRADPADPSVPLVLYDTTTQRDLNLNKEIVHDFCIAGAFALTQKLCEVEVGCVTEEGQVWVQRAGGAALVQSALDLLTAGAYRRPLPPAPAAPVLHHALYIVRTLHGDWVRCIVVSGLDGEGTVRTQLVDSGLILRAPLSSLVPLQTFSMALNDFPPQAVLVSLEGAERVAESMVPRLRALLLGAPVLCRAAPATPRAAPPTPRVVLFVRTGPQKILASVNDCIVAEYDILQLGKDKKEEKHVDHVEALNKKKERIFRSQSQGAGGEERAAPSALPPPTLPTPGQCFDVLIAMAANPWNFVVQPTVTLHPLFSMMNQLQVECPSLSEDTAPLNPASGELYTVRYEKDDTWYRVLVAGCVSNEMVSVYFCDYGDLALFLNSELRPVPAAVPLALSLPPQAIKAKLHDVFPLHQDWAVEDCVRFQQLCVEQRFVAICKDVGKDPLNPTEPLLSIELIDTSTEEDFYINKQFVKEGRAKLASTEKTNTQISA